MKTKSFTITAEIREEGIEISITMDRYKLVTLLTTKPELVADIVNRLISDDIENPYVCRFIIGPGNEDSLTPIIRSFGEMTKSELRLETEEA